MVRDRSVVGSLAGVMKGRNVSMDVKWGLRNSILSPTLTCGSANWTWNGVQQSRVRAAEMSYSIAPDFALNRYREKCRKTRFREMRCM